MAAHPGGNILCLEVTAKYPGQSPSIHAFRVLDQSVMRKITLKRNLLSFYSRKGGGGVIMKKGCEVIEASQNAVFGGRVKVKQWEVGKSKKERQLSRFVRFVSAGKIRQPISVIGS